MNTLHKLTEGNKQTLGISLDRIQERINYIAFDQDKDLASAAKFLIPLAKNHGVNLTAEETRVNVPVLNIIVKEKNQASPTQPQESAIIEATAIKVED